METKDIQKIIDRSVGTEGTLRIPSWWMRKILTDIVKFCEEKADNDALDYFKSYVNKQLTILDDQDSILLNKLDNTNSRVSALESKQLFVILNSLPEKGVENKIYLIPNLNGEDKNVLTEWAWINETWEQFGEFKPEIDLTPYLKISDSPFEKGDVDNSAVLKGGNNIAGNFATALGQFTTASGDMSFAEGDSTTAIGNSSHAEGCETTAEGYYSHAEGTGTTAIGNRSHAEGRDTIANGNNSHAEGYATTAKGRQSHAEGTTTSAIGVTSHAEGDVTTANGSSSHAEGNYTTANGSSSHAEGYKTTATGESSHAEGVCTQTKNNGEHAEGRFNKSNSAVPNEGSNPGNTAHSVGIGTSSTLRKNAHEIMQDGKHYIIGIGGYDGTNPSTAKDVATVINELVDIINPDKLVGGVIEYYETIISIPIEWYGNLYKEYTYEGVEYLKDMFIRANKSLNVHLITKGYDGETPLFIHRALRVERGSKYPTQLCFVTNNSTNFDILYINNITDESFTITNNPIE